MAVTVGPRQAIALHTGARARGLSLPTPMQKTSQQVSILFSETANTTFGEVSAHDRFCFDVRMHVVSCLKSRDRISLLWAVFRSSVTGTRLTRYVGARSYSDGDGSLIKITAHRSLWIRQITRFGARRCTYPRARRSSTNSFAKNLMATYAFSFALSSLFRCKTDDLRGQVMWESDPVREDTTPASGLQSIETSWR